MIDKNKLVQILGEANIFYDEPMSLHTTFKIGGPADYYATPESESDLIALLRYCDEAQVPVFILGNGSNVLVSDKGYRGMIVDLSRLDDVRVDGERIVAAPGATLSKIAKIALSRGLSGYEFASGIPGTIGGAVRMNAGAYGKEHQDVVETVRVLTDAYDILTLSADELDFSYRHSKIIDESMIILSVTLQLEPGVDEEIKSKMSELSRRRREKQPLEYPSAGSVFKRPEGYYAGRLIENIGYKGERVGGAQVSEKHSGFIINTGGATASDVIELISRIQKKIKEEFGLDIEREVIIIGDI